MSQAATDFYTGKKEKFSGELKTVTKTLHRFVWYRLFSFFLIFVPVPVLGFNNWATLALSLAAVIIYFFLVKKNVQHEKRKKKITVLLKITEDELQALQHAFSHFENGESFLNTEHFFTYDLDVFGEGSLFQFLNRTLIKSGNAIAMSTN